MAWNGSDIRNTNGTSAAKRPDGGARKRPSTVRGAFAALAVVALAAGVFFAVRHSQDSDDGDVATPGERSSQKPTPPRQKKTPATDIVKPVAAAPENPQGARQAVTGDWQMVNGFKVPKGARLVRNSLTNRPVRVFQRATDTLIASYLQPPSGGIMPPPMPIPGNAGKKFLESLDTPIEILDTDSDEICRMKEAVIVARAQIKQMMDEGQSFEAILADHYRLTEENTRIRRDAQKELDAIHAQGDAKGAEKYRRTIDLALQQMGIDPLDEPMTNAEKKRKRHLENEAKENIEQGENEL